MKTNRREFLKSSIATGIALSAMPSTRAATDKKYRTALIGAGWWGKNIMKYAIESGECKMTALCDVDKRFLEPAAERVEKLTGDKPKCYTDYRELLEKEKPDIAIVATPDHWHPLITIAAVNAGAHVYVEKPISHTVLEGLAMVKAARENDRVVQVGTHRRVSPHNIAAMNFLRSGGLGKIGMVRSFVHYPGGPGKPTPNEEIPEGLDWNMWCGPAPYRPFNPAIHPRGFRQFLDYANGQIADWGIHWLDQILWWTEEKYPRNISSTGGRFIKQDSTDAPDTQVATFEFESFIATWEHRFYAGNKAESTNIGCYFYGTEGTLHLGWLDGATFYPTSQNKKQKHWEPELHEPDQQNIKELFADFLKCIKTGQRPVCDIEIGHHSTNMSLLAMLSLKLGRSISWDGEKETVIGDPDANKLLKREYRDPWTYPKV